MSLGVLTVGALTLNENYKIADATNAQSGVRTVNLSGVETYPGRTLAQIRAMADDLTSMYGKTVPVTFSHKVDRNGYYTIDDVNTSAVNWDGEAASFTWSLGLTRIGPDNAVDVESRLVSVVRANDFSLPGERWHAPSIGHYGYYAGAVSLAQQQRQTSDGAITVYRNLPVGVNPRWGCPVSGFPVGRVRILSGGIERFGQGISVAVSGWELSNGLVRVKPATAGSTSLLVAFYDGTAWREKAWDILLGADVLVPGTHFRALTVLRVDPESATIRIMAAQPSNGNRVLIDLSLRRGARFLEGYVQRATSGDITVSADVDEWTDPATASAGYLIAAGEDENGIRSAIGSARSFTAIANSIPADGPGITKAATVGLDFWLGAEVGKASAGGTNNDFETGAFAPWVATLNATTSVVTPGKFGTWAGRMQVTAAGPAHITNPTTGVVGVPGRTYTMNGWFRPSTAMTTGVVTFTFMWYDGITKLSETVVNIPTLFAGFWRPISITAPVPAPANTTNIGQRITITGNPAAGTQLDLDNVIVREATDAGDSVLALRDQYVGAMAEQTMVVTR